MGYVTVILLIVASIASLSAFIVSKKPNLKDEMEKITQYSGWVGVALLVIGILTFFGGLGVHYKWWEWLTMDGPWNLARITLILFSPICIILGFIQGYALIDKYVLNKAKASGGGAGEKFDKAGDAAYARLAKMSVPFGFIGLFVGLILILYRLGVLS